MTNDATAPTPEVVRISLLMLRYALADADSSNPAHSLSALDWLESRDEGLISLDTVCANLAAYTRSQQLDARLSLNDAAMMRGQSSVEPEGWRSAVAYVVGAGREERGAFCGLVDTVFDASAPEADQAPEMSSPTRRSPASSGPGGMSL